MLLSTASRSPLAGATRTRRGYVHVGSFRPVHGLKRFAVSRRSRGRTPSLRYLEAIRHYSVAMQIPALKIEPTVSLPGRCFTRDVKLTLARVRLRFLNAQRRVRVEGKSAQGFTGPLRPWMADTSLHGCIHGESRKPLPELAPAESRTNYMSGETRCPPASAISSAFG